MATQRYVSKELSHFIGRGRDESEQYDLMVTILRSGWLLHPPFIPEVSGNVSVNPTARLSQGDMYASEVVCFCDIPADDISLHVDKYSPFGLSFLKTTLIEKGANPVFDVATDSVHSGGKSRAAHFDDAAASDHELSAGFAS